MSQLSIFRLSIIERFRPMLVLCVVMLLTGGCSSVLSRQADWSDRSRPIAFLSERNVQEDGPEPYLLLVAPEGSQVAFLTGVNRIRLGASFTWASDGNAIAVMAYDKTTKINCLMLFDAAGQRCLVNDTVVDMPSWSPDGQWISFSRGNSDSLSHPAMKAIYLVHVATKQVKKLVGMPYAPVDSESTWSPDSKHLAYDVRGESDWILTTSIDGSQTITLTQGTWPAWSPTGNEIAFVRSGKIWLYHLSDKTEDILVDDPVDAGAPAWSADGQKLLFMSKRDGNWEIYRINRDGSDLVRLTNDPAWDGFPAWRPEAK